MELTRGLLSQRPQFTYGGTPLTASHTTRLKGNHFRQPTQNGMHPPPQNATTLAVHDADLQYSQPQALLYVDWNQFVQILRIKCVQIQGSVERLFDTVISHC